MVVSCSSDGYGSGGPRVRARKGLNGWWAAKPLRLVFRARGVVCSKWRPKNAMQGSQIFVLPSCWYLHQKPTNHENAMIAFGGLSCIEKASFQCISAYQNLTNDWVLTEVCALPPATKNLKITTTRGPISAFFCASRRLRFDALVRINVSQNDQVLTDTCSPYPHRTCTKKAKKSQERGGQFRRSFTRWKGFISVY